VPPGPADYVITGEVELVPAAKDSGEKKKKLKAEAKVHIQAEERQDIGLHFKE
jgi:exonuclease III